MHGACFGLRHTKVDGSLAYRPRNEIFQQMWLTVQIRGRPKFVLSERGSRYNAFLGFVFQNNQASERDIPLDQETVGSSELMKSFLVARVILREHPVDLVLWVCLLLNPRIQGIKKRVVGEESEQETDSIEPALGGFEDQVARVIPLKKCKPCWVRRVCG